MRRTKVAAGGLSRLSADSLLLAASAIWGVTFVVQKDIGALSPLAFVAARFTISALALAPLALLESRRAGSPRSPRAWRLAVVIGLMLFLGASLQQAGLATTSATNAGFLTACYVVLTPFVVWALSRRRPRAIVLAAGAVSLIGAWLLATGGGPTRPPTVGDGLVLLADLAWATGIALTPIFLVKTRRPLTFCLFAIRDLRRSRRGRVRGARGSCAGRRLCCRAPAILFAGLVSGAVGYTLQVIGQRYTPPAEAALILSMESVFAAVAGAIWLGESLSVAGAIGCALILFGALAAEAAPALDATISAEPTLSASRARDDGSRRPRRRASSSARDPPKKAG